MEVNKLPFPVLFEDNDVIVINKPAGVIVNRAETVKTQTVQSVMSEYLSLTLSPSLDSSYEEKLMYERSGIVHRLDKDTSGILLIAKNPASLVDLLEQFKMRRVEKHYYALVHGRVEPKEGTVNAPVGRLPWNRERFGVFPGGREAVTDYSLVSYYQSPEQEELSYLLVKPHTGRTHQIRVHLQYSKHPIVSDVWYGGRKTVRNDLIWCPRLFLHAAYLCFTHPVTKKKMEITAPLSKDLQDVLVQLTHI